MKALSIRQPWAWLIANGFKDIENRDWYTGFRGPFLVHAAKGCTFDEWGDAWGFAQRVSPPAFDRARHIGLTIKSIERGGFVGVANLTGCVRASESPWFFGEFGFQIDHARRVTFTPYRGMLGFFDVPQAIADRIVEARP